MAESAKIKIIHRIENKSEYGPCIQALPNGCCWVTSPSRRSLHLLDNPGKSVLQDIELELEDEDSDFDIHIFYVCQNGDIFLQEMDNFDKYLYKYNKEEGLEVFDDIGIFTIWSIFVTKEGHVLTSQQCEDESGKCVLYDQQGNIILTIEDDDKGEPYFDYPICAVENQNGDICVSDLYKPGVFIFTKDGKLKNIFSGSNLSESETFHPCGVTCDTENNIFILDKRNKRIDVIDEDGVYVCKLMDSKDGLKEPDMISIGEDGVMYISQNQADTLVVQYKYPL